MRSSPPSDRRPTVVVVGASDIDSDTFEQARALGQAIAKAGWNLACGGGGGVMEACCQGFALGAGPGGGVSIGVLPSDGADWANEYVQVAIPTGMGWARNTILVRMADVVVAMAGGSGTLSEIAFAWQMGKPIIAMSNTGGWARQLAGLALDDRRSDTIIESESTQQTVKILFELIGKQTK